MMCCVVHGLHPCSWRFVEVEVGALYCEDWQKIETELPPLRTRTDEAIEKCEDAQEKFNRKAERFLSQVANDKRLDLNTTEFQKSRDMTTEFKSINFACC